MPIRTNPGAVQALLVGEYDGQTDLIRDPLGFRAGGLGRVGGLFGSIEGLLLHEYGSAGCIECLLACHYYQLSDPAYKSRTTAGASGGFAGKADGIAFLGTRFGEMALAQDISGILQQKQKEIEEGGRRRIQVFAASTPGNYASNEEYHE